MKACIFDLDGTLLDSMDVWKNIDIEFLKKRGIIAPTDYADAIASMSMSEVAAYTIERFALSDSVFSLMQEWNDMAIHAYANTVQMKPRAKEYLQLLRKQEIKLAVATNLPKELYVPALYNHDIYDLFHVHCCADEVGCGKSRPDIFLLAAKKLGVSPKDCVVFEDVLKAVKSAKSVGMTVYGVYDKSSKADLEQIKQVADGVLFDFQDAFSCKELSFCRYENL